MRSTSLLLLLAVLSLASCEKGTDVKCEISNQSSEKITVKVYYKYLTTGVRETTLSPNETKEVFYASHGIGGFHENTSIENVVDSIKGLTETGKELKRLYNGINDWNKSSNKKKQTITFSSTITDSDIK